MRIWSLFFLSNTRRIFLTRQLLEEGKLYRARRKRLSVLAVEACGPLGDWVGMCLCGRGFHTAAFAHHRSSDRPSVLLLPSLSIPSTVTVGFQNSLLLPRPDLIFVTMAADLGCWITLVHLMPPICMEGNCRIQHREGAVSGFRWETSIAPRAIWSDDKEHGEKIKVMKDLVMIGGIRMEQKDMEGV
ncbi:hypothetical protein ACLOJK_034487 [Asimina triloba]